MSEELQHAKLSYNEAKQITDDIRSSVENVWTLLKKAYEGSAWEVLNYPSWREYAAKEFQMSEPRAYQMLNFAKVQENFSTIVEKPRTESQARPLTKLDTPEQQREAWQEAVETSGGKPTAKHVEAAVEKVKAKAAEVEVIPPIEDEPEPQKKAEPFTYQPSDGLQYAEIAILQLSKIHKNDTQRKQAFTHIQNWLQKNS